MSISSSYLSGGAERRQAGPSPRLGFLQQAFHPCPALSRRLFRSASAAPVSFQTYGKVIAVAFERLELSEPIHNAAAHRRPVVADALLYGVLAMAMADSFFRQKIVAVGERLFAAGGRVAGIPVQHKVRRLDGAEHLRRLRPRGRVQRGIVFQEQRNSFFPCPGSRVQQLLVDRGAVGCGIVESTEVEAAQAFRAE